MVLCAFAFVPLGCELIEALVRGNPQPAPTKAFGFRYLVAQDNGSGAYLVPGAGSASSCTVGPLPPLQIAQMVQSRGVHWDALTQCGTAFSADLSAPSTHAGFPDILDSSGQTTGERLEFRVFGPSGDAISELNSQTTVDVTHRNKVTQGVITISLATGEVFTCAQQDAGDPWHLNPTPSDQFFEMQLDARDRQADELKARFQCIGLQTTPSVASPPLIIVMDGDVFMDY